MRSIKAALLGAAVITGAAFYAGPAAAYLKEVIVVQSLDVGTPLLIDLYPEERLRMAPVEPKAPSDEGAGRTAD